MRVTEGASARFETKIGGSPAPTVQWLKDDAVVAPSANLQVRTLSQLYSDNNPVLEKQKQITMDKERSSLLMKQTRVQDSGVYTCRATNTAGEAKASAELIVLPKQK